MGIFSSKKKTYVATHINRVVEDNVIPDMRQKNIIDSVFEDKRLTQSIVNNALSSHAIKLERGYRFAARGRYHYGTPNHNIRNAADGEVTVKNIIEVELGQTVTLNYFHFAPINNLHYGWQRLVEDYGYDEFSNEVVTLSNQTGKKTWVKDLVGHINTVGITSDSTAETEEQRVADPGTMDVWDRHPQERYIPSRSGTKTPVWLFGSDVSDGVMVHLIDEDGVESDLFFSTDQFSADLECFQAKYRYQINGTNRIGYFTYEYSSGQYPELDSVHEGNAVGKGSFFPIVFFRHNDVNRTAGAYHDTEAYKSSVHLMNLMGLDYQEMGDSVNENPDADKLQQAVLMFAVPANTNDSTEMEYLYKFFDWLYKQSGGTAMSRGNEFSRPGQAIEIRDADFNTTLSYSGLRRKRHTGNLGKKGTYHHQLFQETRYRTIRSRTGPKDDPTYTTFDYPYTVDLLKYSYQVTPTQYDEIIVEGLQLRYNIYGNLGVTANVTSDKLLIPLDYQISRTLRFDRKEKLYYRSMHLVFNSKITKTVKWYERGAFQIVLFIAAVVITVFTAGAGTPIATALATSAYATLALLVIEVIITQLVVSLLVQEAFEVVVKELGIEAGIVLSVVAFIAAAYGVHVGADWAMAAMQAGNGLMNGSQAAMQQKLMEYKSESQEFELLAEEKMEELEEIDNLLNQYDLLDPRSFIGRVPTINPGESPSAMYDRTVHAGNPGILQYDYIESYVAINTQLPTFNELVGDTFYGRT